MAPKRSSATEESRPKKARRVAEEASPGSSSNENDQDEHSGSESEEEKPEEETSVTIDGTSGEDGAEEVKTFAELVSSTSAT